MSAMGQVEQPRPARGAGRAGGVATEATLPEATQYLTFQLGEEIFAVGILTIKEILEYPKLTTLPMAIPCVRGVMNLRGAAVPVFDLMECFAKPPRPVEKRTCVVIVEIPMAGETRVVGIVVDAVYAVLDIAPTDVEPPPSILNRIRHEFIQGLGKVDGRFVILLKLDAVLAASADVAIPGVAA